MPTHLPHFVCISCHLIRFLHIYTAHCAEKLGTMSIPKLDILNTMYTGRGLTSSWKYPIHVWWLNLHMFGCHIRINLIRKMKRLTKDLQVLLDIGNKAGLPSSTCESFHLLNYYYINVCQSPGCWLCLQIVSKLVASQQPHDTVYSSNTTHIKLVCKRWMEYGSCRKWIYTGAWH